MKLQSVLLVAVAITISCADAKKNKDKKGWKDDRELLQSDVKYYDCSGHENGNEIHPWDCTRYIKCSNDHAYDISCPFCTRNAETCPNGWKVFDAETGSCGHANEVECEVSGTIGKDEALKMQFTIPGGGGSWRPPRSPGTELTWGPPWGTTDDEIDHRCVSQNCEYQPKPCDCHSFFRCCHGSYSEHKCPEGLLFNLESHQCDEPDAAQCYQTPSICCPCHYYQEEDQICSPAYLFQDCDRNASLYLGPEHCLQEQHQCEHGLVWNEDALGGAPMCDLKENTPECNGGTGRPRPSRPHETEPTSTVRYHKENDFDADIEKDHNDSDYIRIKMIK